MRQESAMFSVAAAFREDSFCGVTSCVCNKFGCAVGEEMSWNTDVGRLNSGRRQRKCMD